ncbi:hypothetical protein I3J09_12655 [Streptomyces clavuligerus]|uniref:trypsin-like serine peptidase n=1 Tax=Streptomyces clavuligerus TaxID=1901 RepID=UPI0002EF76E1|nr:hypothetical protein [Streptomyces clavuligerus]ANW18998.1 hypothetical protein BB341_12515 [Streptomyces clavuligerus]AXU13580.1 hypothetical protein D1794_12975 [Streptomyces clavuligerus]MBY6303538.1 hypothetical protein [Streptomyces clavuligerus]QCS06364.1 hypothetical protein CRV15_12410 [Streptomyces clavuligerus]QPJ94285.1 hypothetical protein GE265_15580 [Streptomyces clavuligerus]
MRPSRRILVSSMAVAALLATSSGLASAIPADAGRPADGAATLSARATLADGARVDSRSEIDRLEKYWTPERMAKAVPADVPGPRAALPAAPPRGAGPTGRPGTTPAAPPLKAGERAAPRVNESSAVGKVYFRNPVNGGDYMCSAAAINSPSKQMVTTAGHCVNTGGVNGVAGHWMQNWVYIPRYRSGARPFGTYAAKEYRSFNGWINSGDLTRDVAMVTTWPLNGARVVDATGGHGLSWNFSRTQHMTVLGYPGNKDNGELQWACQGTTQQDGAGPKIAMHCDFGGGSSGGPWLRELNDANGLGSQNGVMSTISSGGWNQSPYFDDPVKAMFDAQGSIT